LAFDIIKKAEDNLKLITDESKIKTILNLYAKKGQKLEFSKLPIKCQDNTEFLLNENISLTETAWERGNTNDSKIYYKDINELLKGIDNEIFKNNVNDIFRKINEELL
jgi:hypothetical protein